MKESCEILSQMTNLASVVIGQSVDDEKLVSVQVIPLSNNTATAVFVTDKGYVENKTFLMEEGTKVDQVVKTVKLLNDRLTGTPLSQVVSKMEALRPALTDYMVGQELIYEAIMGVFAKLATERMELYGQEELYKQPEFANDASKLRELLSFIDDPEEFKRILKSGKTSGNITISIGNKEYGYENLALVSTNINVPGEKGTLSVLGPARMDYDKVVATLQYFAEALDNYFSATTKGGQECSTKEKKKNAKSPNSPKKKAKK
jgi:heat-inducible transcriptional repressor